MGSKRGHILGVVSEDPVLAWVGPIGLALAAGTALILDLSARHTGARTLADILEHGPSLAELSPGRRGVATIGSGPLPEDALPGVIEPLARSWPALVIRGVAPDISTVPYRPVYPGGLTDRVSVPAVWQVCPGAATRSLAGPVLPRLTKRSVNAMLVGRRPLSRRWIGAWRQVWEMPWV